MSMIRCLLLMAVLATSTRAAQPEPAYPPSPVIAAIEWAPRETIIRRAEDGDNWPLTWADDDALYTTWGDGTGFAPKVERETQLWICTRLRAAGPVQGSQYPQSGRASGGGTPRTEELGNPLCG